jgi:hypothetical protein
MLDDSSSIVFHLLHSNRLFQGLLMLHHYLIMLLVYNNQLQFSYPSLLQILKNNNFLIYLSLEYATKMLIFHIVKLLYLVFCQFQIHTHDTQQDNNRLGLFLIFFQIYLLHLLTISLHHDISLQNFIYK